ncbi:MAG: diacylglycerol kinase family lipid kinase [Planctomycetes bacterium]|nr:diacylglycerol kinase family lipid kinase [Planctomycetota bacterium]
MKKLGIIVNPIAGAGRGKLLLKRLLTELKRSDYEPFVKETSKAGDGCKTASRGNEFDALVCIGGDGTINEVINGLSDIKFSVPLGIIPVGSGNVIAKELKITSNVKEFVCLLNSGKTMMLDIGKINFGSDKEKPRLFISMAGVGFDAEVADQHHKRRKGADFHPHTTSYVPIALKTAMYYKLPKLTLKIDGKLITEKAAFIQVANSRSYGGPLVFAQKAKTDDGLLDIVWFKAQSGREIIRYYLDAFWGDVTKNMNSSYHHGRKIRISSPDKVPVQVDGDFCGYLPINIEVIHKTIPVFAEHN